MLRRRHSSSNSSERVLLAAIGFAVLLRIVSVGWYPVSDTTESRYAEMARVMVASGDWITPWYDVGVPFWGKPPLSMWMTALSMRMLGTSDWAARLPHALAGALVAWLVWSTARQRGRREAIYSLAALVGSALFFIASGAVMTDMALLVGITVVMTSFWRALHSTSIARPWNRWMPFVGVAIGLLAKGPVALVLIGLPLSVWMLWTGNVRRSWRALPWVLGTLSAALVVAPWYVLAELRTPGFLDYFIVGEHWLRFTIPGWSGDRYGNAHLRVPGSIWVDAAVAYLPWTLMLPLLALGRRTVADDPTGSTERVAWIRYLLLWSIAPILFFTTSRNILWTYVLPSAPPFALLVGWWLARDVRHSRVNAVLAAGLISTCLLFASFLAWTHGTGKFKSAQEVISAFDARQLPGAALAFVGRNQYSAKFYSKGTAVFVEDRADLVPQLEALMKSTGRPVFLALRLGQWEKLQAASQQRLRIEGFYGRYVLLSVKG